MTRQAELDMLDKIIAVGEPGCYVVPGHLDTADALAMLSAVVIHWSEGEFEGLSMPRHTWMQVTYGEGGHECDRYYREVYEHEVGAEPYTLIECVGEWVAPWDRQAGDE